MSPIMGIGDWNCRNAPIMLQSRGREVSNAVPGREPETSDGNSLEQKVPDMTQKTLRRCVCWSIVGLVGGSQVHASFHFMQIEQVIAGVNGDAAAQAVQLRMRSAAQDEVQQGRLIAWDAAGSNPVVLIDFSKGVSMDAAGSRILVASEALAAYTDLPLMADFTMTRLIPESYLAAGSLTLENDEGTLLVWRFGWGGAAYTGSTSGSLGNDDDRDYGPTWPEALATSGLSSLLFAGGATDKSTSNATDYAVSDPAMLTNNAGATFFLVVPDCDDALGRGPDTDGDGVRDACDDCRHDPSKAQPGVCGCGTPDDDVDANGVMDCTESNAGDGDGGMLDEEMDDDSNSDEGAGDSQPPGTGQGSGTIRSPCSPGAASVLLMAVYICFLRVGGLRR